MRIRGGGKAEGRGVGTVREGCEGVVGSQRCVLVLEGQVGIREGHS